MIQSLKQFVKTIFLKFDLKVYAHEISTNFESSL